MGGEVRTETSLINGDIIRRKLKALPIKIAKNILNTAVLKAAKELLQEVVNNAPVGETGELSNSLRAVMTRKRDKNQVAAKVSTTVYYARFVEFGTVKMSAKPFMRPAFDKKEKELIDIVKNQIESRLEKEVNS